MFIHLSTNSYLHNYLQVRKLKLTKVKFCLKTHNQQNVRSHTRLGLSALMTTIVPFMNSDV